MLFYHTDCWSTGIAALCRASYSAAQALGIDLAQTPLAPYELTMRTATLTLLDNIRYDVERGDVVSPCNIDARGITRVDYWTRNGLRFGWGMTDDDKFVFMIDHPDKRFSEGSTLAESARAAGFHAR